jgi:hypothetical protein
MHRKFLVGKPETKKKKTLGIPRSGWQSNVKVDLRERECEGVD